MAPPRQKKYHRRGPWACDECRLRKRKCDGAQPCAPCTSTAYSCTYESRSPVQAPTRRIRSLEEKLRHACAVLKRLKAGGFNTNDVDIESALQVLQCGPPPRLNIDTPAEESDTEKQKVNNMMGGCGQFISRPGSSEAFFGASSGVSFICHTLELFLEDLGAIPSTINIHSALLDLFDGHIPEKWRLNPHLHNLPNIPGRATTSRLLDSLFARCSLISQLLQEAEVREMMNRIHGWSPQHREAHIERPLMLAHSILAVAHLYHTSQHRNLGCRAAIGEALQHFFAARSALDISQCNDFTSLQTLLCVVIFLVSTSRLVAAHPYIGVACSSALRLGLHTQSPEFLLLTTEQRETRLRTLVTILKLDVYSSLVLGLPPFVDLSSLNHGLVSCVNNLPSYRTSPSGSNCEISLRMELSLKHFEILKITALGLKAVFPQSKASGIVDGINDAFPVNIKQLEDVDEQFQLWARNCSSDFGRVGDDAEYDIAKYELEMAYHFGRIVMSQPFLHYLRRIANGATLFRNQSRHALICLKVSSIAITRSEEMMKRGLLCSASWMSVYTIFHSVVSLVFLIAAHTGTSKPGEAWKKANRGIRLLAAARCHNDGATACLRILKGLISELSHTVDFDLEHIEFSTARLCQYNHLPEDDADQLDATSLEVLSHVNQHSGQVSRLWNHSGIISSSHPLQADQSSQAHSEHGSLRNDASQCDADKILAQAQGISLGHRLSDFIIDDDAS